MSDPETIYSRTLVAAKDARDGETPTRFELSDLGELLVLELSSCDGAKLLGAWRPWERNKAIEQTVQLLTRAGDKAVDVIFSLPGLELGELGRISQVVQS